MNFLARIIRFVFWLVIVSWSVALLRRVVGWMLRGGSNAPAAGSVAGASAVGMRDTIQTPPGGARRLVRDPVCGVHVAEVLSIPLREGGEVVHFCSKACRDKYAASMNPQKFAANG
jgi:YHS domain-containing protein